MKLKSSLALVLAVGLAFFSISARAASGSLTYSNFAGTCNANGINSTATGTSTFPGPFTAYGSTRLNGVPDTTYSWVMATSPNTWPTTFNRTFPTPEPDDTYTYVYSLAVTMDAGGYQGVSIVTINCTAGVFSATDVWQPYTPVPTVSQYTLLLLALLLAAGAAWHLRRV